MKYPDYFCLKRIRYRSSTTKCTTKPVGKILDKLAIVFEAATASKSAFYSPLTLNHITDHNFSEEKTVNVSEKCDLFTLRNTIYSSLPSLGISFWAWADTLTKITHALPDVRDLRTSGNGCDQSPPFLRPRDQKKRRLWGRECVTFTFCACSLWFSNDWQISLLERS